MIGMIGMLVVFWLLGMVLAFHTWFRPPVKRSDAKYLWVLVVLWPVSTMLLVLTALRKPWEQQ